MDAKPTAPAGSWYGLRCLLQLCPCRAEFDGAEQWAVCQLCGEKKVPLNAAAIKAELKSR